MGILFSHKPLPHSSSRAGGVRSPWDLETPTLFFLFFPSFFLFCHGPLCHRWLLEQRFEGWRGRGGDVAGAWRGQLAPVMFRDRFRFDYQLRQRMVQEAQLMEAAKDAELAQRQAATGPSGDRYCLSSFPPATVISPSFMPALLPNKPLTF